VEWFARTAQALFGPGRGFALRDVQVLNGVVADGFHDGRDLELRVQTSTGDGHRDRLELVDRTGRRRYRCEAVQLDDDGAAPALLAGPATALHPIYDGAGVLFHGPAFQVLHDVRLHHDAGLTASVSGVAGVGWPDVRWGADGGVVGRGWPPEPWRTDPCVVDGALQLALLWSDHVIGGPSLPTSISLVRVLDRPRQGSLRATLVGRGATNARVRSDVVVTDAEGAVVTVLEGIETHALPRPGGARAERDRPAF
jgi:hypothetical protein